VLGVMEGFRRLGWEVVPYILGDRLPAWFSSDGSERWAAGGRWRTVGSDLVRLCLRPVVPWLARSTLGSGFNWVYERFSVLQQLGLPFQRSGIPWILETNSPAAQEAFRERKSLRLFQLANRWERQAYLACDVLVCVSELLKRDLVRDMGIPEWKIVVSPVAVDPGRFDPAQARPERAHEGLTIGFAGRLYPWQSLDVLFRGARLARDRGAPRLNIVVVGGGMAEREFRRAAQEAGPGVHVEFTGHVSMQRVPDLIASFDLGYVGPRAIGRHGMYFSPVKLLEYMAMGRPVLCANHEGFAGLVREGETGFLFEPEDPDSLAQAILRAVQGRARLAELGRKARRAVLDGHTWELRAADLSGQIEAVLAHAGRR
jgi:glycosyltransferase involved in cell wall biosynthesis